MQANKMLRRFMFSIYGKGFLPGLATVFLCAAVTSTAQFFLTYYLGIIIDSVDDGFQTVIRQFFNISVAVIINVAANALLGLVSGRMTNRFMKNIRERLGNILCRSEYAELEKIKDGDLLSTITNDTEVFSPWLNSLFSTGHIPAKVFLVFAAYFTMSWKLTLAMIPVVPLAMLPSLLLSKKLHKLNTAEREMTAKTISFLSSSLNFMLMLKSLCLEKVFVAKNHKLLSGTEKVRMNKTLREQMIQTFGRCFGHIMNPLIFIAGAYFIIRGEMTVGQIVSFMLFANMIAEALNIIYAIPTNYQAAKVGMERVNKILVLPLERDSGTIDISERTETVPSVFNLSNLTFSHGGRTILQEISFSVCRGEKIAVIGMSGSGKTTLFKLLCGLYHPDHGCITYQNVDISAFPNGILKSELSIVPQESFLFNDSIRENIRIAKPDADDGDIIRACVNAQIHEFIMTLEQGYDTILKDANRSMSKGQMQRVNLARAFLKDASVYLLDEPTSALDANTHRAIINYIIDGIDEKTVIAIMHRLTEPQRFDKILVMKDGNISGFGHHDNLINTNREYLTMLETMASADEKKEETA